MDPDPDYVIAMKLQVKLPYFRKLIRNFMISKRNMIKTKEQSLPKTNQMLTTKAKISL